MLSWILTLLIISVIYPAKSTTVEFKPSDFASDLDILWYYFLVVREPCDKAYIELPEATFTIRYKNERGREKYLVFEGEFTEYLSPRKSLFKKREAKINEYSGIYINENGEFYGFPTNDGENRRTEIKPNSPLRYFKREKTDIKAPYVSIRYASFQEIQNEINDVFEDFDTNKKYYSQRSYVIPHGRDGHIIQFVEKEYSNAMKQEDYDLDIKVLSGSVSEDGVLKITGSTTEPFLLYDSNSKTAQAYSKGVIGIRMTKIGVLAHRDGQNELSLFRANYLVDYYQEKFIRMKYIDFYIGHLYRFGWDGWEDCNEEEPPSRLEKGFLFVNQGQVFKMRCAFPYDKNNGERKEYRKAVVIDIAIKNHRTKFVYYDDYRKREVSSLQLFFHRKSWDMFDEASSYHYTIGTSETIKYYY